MLGGKEAYQRFMMDGVEAGHKEEYYEVEDQRFLGPEGFGEKLENQVSKEKAVSQRRKPLDRTLDGLAKKVGVDAETLRGADRSWGTSGARAIVACVLVRRLGYPLVEVASCLGRDMATVSSLMPRLSERMESNRDLKGQVDRLAKDYLE
jgi:chromosomal replication initiation ATPase DnaA